MAVFDGFARHVSFEKDASGGDVIKAILEVLSHLVKAPTHPDYTRLLVRGLACINVIDKLGSGVTANDWLEVVLVHQLASDKTSAGTNVENFRVHGCVCFLRQPDDFINDVVGLIEVDSAHLLLVALGSEVVVEIAHVLVRWVVFRELLLGEGAVFCLHWCVNCVLNHLSVCSLLFYFKISNYNKICCHFQSRIIAFKMCYFYLPSHNLL